MEVGEDMTEKRIKSALMLIGEALVIWYGMGTPIPTDIESTVKLAVAILAITYTGYKNHDFTPEGCEGTGYTRMQKLINAGVDIGVNVDDLDYLEDGDADDEL